VANASPVRDKGELSTSNLPEPLARTVELRPQENALSLSDLWLRCFALGSMNTQTELGAFLSGELRPTRHEYNVLAVALNEYLSDVGVAQFVPYVECPELAGTPRSPRWRTSVDPATR
jgi:hypothetical protein